MSLRSFFQKMMLRWRGGFVKQTYLKKLTEPEEENK
jgi:hypothetical protein